MAKMEYPDAGARRDARENGIADGEGLFSAVNAGRVEEFRADAHRADGCFSAVRAGRADEEFRADADRADDCFSAANPGRAAEEFRVDADADAKIPGWKGARLYKRFDS